MLSILESTTIEEASGDLLEFALDPENWVPLERSERGYSSAVSRIPYQRAVGALRVQAWVDVRPDLRTYLRVAFRAPGLTPQGAADHLEQFLQARMPLLPNTEWEVELDTRNWIHFLRPYTTGKLKA
jgi:hypothetical protein